MMRYVLHAATCQYVLRHDFDLHLNRMLGGISDVGADMGDLADEHGVQELCLLYPNQRGHTAVLETRVGGKKVELSNLS